MKATMKDVAKLAGVGVGTVSRVLNNGSVKDETRDKVERAIDKLDYQTNQYARGLKINRTHTVALILPSVWHPFFSEFAFYVETYLERNKYKTFLCNSNNDAEKEKEYIQMVTQNKVDGIIGITYSDIDKFVSSNLPFVSIDRHFTEDVIYVTADNKAGGQMAVRELVKRGCKNLAYIGGYQNISNETKNRYISFIEECEAQNIDYNFLNIEEPIDDLSEQLERFFTENPQIDGVFTINDSMAIDVHQYLEENGVKVPDEIQIIGFDGQKIKEGTPYIVSTIVQPIEEMAKQSVNLLIKTIEGQKVPNRTVLPVTFGQGVTTKDI